MLQFLLDEDTPGPLADAIDRHNALSLGLPIDAVRVGQFGAPPSGTTDPDNLIWAEAEDRLLVSRDYNTLRQHLADHLAAGRHSPGVLLTRPGRTIPELLNSLELIAHAGHTDDFRDQVRYIPL